MKHDKAIILVRLVTLFCLLAAGCAAPQGPLPTSRLESAYEAGFFSLPRPSTSEVKANGIASPVFQLPQNEAWQAALLVIMQRAPVVSASEQTGVILAPPYAVFLEKSPDIRLYVWFMDSLYKAANNPKKDVQKIKPEEIFDYENTLLQQFQAQLMASSNLKSGGKWSYLSK